MPIIHLFIYLFIIERVLDDDDSPKNADSSVPVQTNTDQEALSKTGTQYNVIYYISVHYCIVGFFLDCKLLFFFKL